ncbi:uncharacterized protein LOC111624315 [Centruroides sculpturatus]|uniref:uncharacterized protein LOC111624315 n=1 Tax=Centruroides sculpturatus TaxID=218467 RepID=UPI000C6DCC50|nr:uncharacterized protein LOC111624315 [Centruroides sculpturatus]
MAATIEFPPVTFSSTFLPYFIQVAKSNGNKNSELAEVVQQKNLQNLKKAPKKKWKRLTRSGIRTQPKKLETELAECQLAYAKGVLENIDNDDLTLLHLLALVSSYT